MCSYNNKRAKLITMINMVTIKLQYPQENNVTHMDLCLWLPYIQTLEMNEGKLILKIDGSIKIHPYILSKCTT